MSDPHIRALVLGRRLDMSGITSYEWDDAPRNLSLIEYDLIIVDLSGPDSPGNFPMTASNGFARVIFRSQARVVVVGPPVTIRTSDNNWILDNGFRNRAGWLPSFPEVIVTSGSEIRWLGAEYQRYGKHVDSYVFTVVGKSVQDHDNQSYESYVETACSTRGLSPRGARLQTEVREIAGNKAGEYVAFRIKFGVSSYEGIKTGEGYVDWLPAPKNPYDLDVWIDLLNDLGCTVFSPLPSWVRSHRTPCQGRIEEKIAEMESELQALHDSLVGKRAELLHEARFSKLIYESGTPLEVIVRETLGLLGADVEEPTDPGGDDGRVVTPDGGHATLEIKGVGGFVSAANLRQLSQWVDVAIEQYPEREWKGIMVCNVHRDQPLETRKGAYSGAACEQLVLTRGLCVITTMELYRQVCNLQKGEFSAESFWRRVMATNGVLAFE